MAYNSDLIGLKNTLSNNIVLNESGLNPRCVRTVHVLLIRLACE